MTPANKLFCALAAMTMTAALVHAQRASVEVVTTGGGPAGASTAMLPVQQTGSGILVGQVVDAGDNRPIAGAIVAIGGSINLNGAPAGPRIVMGGPGGPIDLGGGPNQVPRVMTDGDGRFAFRNLPKGSFTLTAQKPGYLEGAYGRIRAGGAPQSLDLGEGERKGDVAIRLFRPASITGLIVDEAGDPVVGIQVRAYRRNLVSGRRVLTPAPGGTAQTDDRGIYRLSNLTPGEYIVAVPTVHTSTPASFAIAGGLPPDLLATAMTPGNTGFSFGSGGAQVTPDGRFLLQSRSVAAAGPDGRLHAYPTLYYPSAAVVSEAQPIVVGSGDERSAVDMTLVPVPTFTIAGRLMGPDGPASTYALHLVPSNTGDLSADPDVATGITDADGSFMFLGVPAGQYVIQTVRVPRGVRGGVNIAGAGGGGGAVSFALQRVDGPGPPAAASGPTLWTAAPVAVGGQDLTDLTLTLREGATIAGAIEFEGSAQKPAPDRMQLIAVSIEQADGRTRVNIPPARADQSGRFTTAGLLPGRYLLRANPPPGWTLKQVMVNGVDAADTPIEIDGRDLSGVVVTFSDRLSDLSGSVRDAQGAVDANAAVLVFPTDERQWSDYGLNPRRLRMARTTSLGAYRFGSLPPGEYYAVAISESVAGDWQDPALLRQLSRDATRITVGEGGSHTQHLSTRAVQRLVRNGPEGPALHSVDRGSEREAHGPFVPEELQARDTRPVTQTRDTTAEATGTSSISGIVLLDDASGRPLRRARVSARSADQRVERAAVTDDEGRFRIDNLAAGRYSVIATRPAYVTAYYGSKRAGRGPGAPVALAAGQQLEGLTLRMPRGGVITGRVLDEFGLPVPNAQTRLFQYRNVSTGRALTPATGVMTFISTDDRGAFRLYGLPAGEYVLSVSPPAGGGDVRRMSADDIRTAVADLKQVSPVTPAPEGQARGAGASGVPGNNPPPPFGGRPVALANVYYPGTPLPEDATTIRVAAGQEVANVDVPLRLLPTARVSGSITGPDGRPASGVQVMVLPATSDLHVAGVPMLMVSSGFIRTGQEGTFQTGPLPPGRYLLAARAGGDASPIVQMGGGDVFVSRTSVAATSMTPQQPSAPTTPLWAQQHVDVNGEDLSDVHLTLQEGMTVTGRLRFDGTTLQPPDPAQVRLNLIPAGSGGISIGVPGAKIDAAGQFTFAGVTPGRYRVMGNAPITGFTAAQGWQLKSAITEGRDTLDTDLEIAPGQNVSDLAVTFTDKSTELSGKLQDASGNPVSDLMILVFSTDRAHWSPRSRRLRQPTQPGSDGLFKFTGLPPGDYYLAAVTDLEQGDWGDPAFMEQVAAAAIRITLGEGEKKTQDIRIGGH